MRRDRYDRRVRHDHYDQGGIGIVLLLILLLGAAGGPAGLIVALLVIAIVGCFL